MMPLSEKDIEHASPISTKNSSSSSSATMSSWFFEMDPHKRNQILKDYRTQAASASSTLLATMAVTPLENIKTRMQMHNFKNLTECTKYILRSEGLKGFTAGALPPLLSITFVRVSSFSAYQKAKYAISGWFERNTGVSPLVAYNTPGSLPTIPICLCFTGAGMVAGLAASPVACPFELAKNVVQSSVLMSNRSQASASGVKDPTLRNMPRIGTFEAIRQIISRHGFRGLYTGYPLHAIRDTIGTGLYFGIYETAKQTIAAFSGREQNQSPFGPPMVAGALSGTIPWICTYTLDTKKTRAQSILLGKSREIGELSVAVARSSMYKGLSVSILRTMVQNMILLSTFEYLKIKINKLDENETKSKDAVK